MLEDLCDSFSLKVASRMGQISHHLNAKNPFIIADASHLYNALQNIIDNAEKYSPEAPQIVIASFEENQHLVISVSDSGVGMTKQVQARIFDTFYRQTSGNIHNVKGFGLGLSYVKTVIECHQGQVAVSSRPGKGSEFKIYLPYTHEQKT